jgi:hypothetical protein
MLPARLMLDRLKTEAVYARMGSKGDGLPGLASGLLETSLDLVVDALRTALRP